MSSFLPVNMVATPSQRNMDGATGSSNSSTPHADSSKLPFPKLPTSSSGTNVDNERDSGYGTVNGEYEKRSNNSPPTSNAASIGSPGRTHSREGSSTQSSVPDDHAVAESDGDQEGGSENGADMGDVGPPSKKKKGQRFFCTDFPPCSLSFTRSEHLARHIRKHTGERPFQCHCSRRFSRLDNLRQHAQTVHVNEDIPGDSLAATGTRFQRQIRTDRVRPPGRNRAGTTGSQGGHSRGHSRNLSTSSVGSTVSSYSQTQEIRRRPPPLMMANDGSARARLSLDTMHSPPRTPPGQVHGFSTQSPSSNMFTPTSAIYPNGEGGSYYGSPGSSTSGFWSERTSGRRLSFPSGSRPFDPTNTYQPPYARPLAPSNPSYPNSGSILGSPNTPQTPRDESGLPAAESDWRRRTWHPSTQSAFSRPPTSGFWFSQPPDRPQPNFPLNPPHGQSQPTRLPGIESFDQIQQRPSTPPRREPSPMQVDGPPQTSNAAPAFAPQFKPYAPGARPPPPISGPGHRRGHVSFDMTIRQNLNKLDIGESPSTNKDASQWSQQTIGELRNIASRPFGPYEQQSAEPTVNRTQDSARRPEQPPADTSSSTGPTTPTQNKRRGWYNGPLPTHTSPEDSSSSEGVATPSASAPEYHPAIVPSHGDIERHHSRVQTDATHNACAPQATQPNTISNPEPRHAFYSGNSGHHAGGMARLEALVAVATSEDKGGGKFI
ncbi:hypothetical protein AJ79_04308 [Helicocarpus griseus UAMH5409]|uniref:C2H2-type domain-containing protein n=1 Tax=Helicocarpus griseus UAMH5409 TaxID=1447875 RepID=A0A2B7XTQ0_9EURO|nr:hypothetical protein AJ79_04308 [Helicocarpus griseus UAMH5409]